MEKIEKTPLGWLINLLFLFAHACTILAEFIDQQLMIATLENKGFVREKKKALNDYNECIKKAGEWLLKADEKMQIFDPDGTTFEAVRENGKMYSNSIASANSLIRFAMLLIDRSQATGGEARAFKRMRSLPENGVFTEEYISRFNMKYEIVPEEGDLIENPNHGKGKLDFHVGRGNWQCIFDNGDKVILNEKQFKLL